MKNILDPALTVKTTLNPGDWFYVVDDDEVTDCRMAGSVLLDMISNLQAQITAIGVPLKPPSDIDCSANPNYPAMNAGDTRLVTVAGKIGGASGPTVELNDWIICKATNAGGTQAAVGSNFFITQANLIGALLESTSFNGDVSGLYNALTLTRRSAGRGDMIGWDGSAQSPIGNSLSGTWRYLSATTLPYTGAQDLSFNTATPASATSVNFTAKSVNGGDVADGILQSVRVGSLILFRVNGTGSRGFMLVRVRAAPTNSVVADGTLGNVTGRAFSFVKVAADSFTPSNNDLITVSFIPMPSQALLGNGGNQVTGNYTVSVDDIGLPLEINSSGSATITIPADVLYAAHETGHVIMIPWHTLGAGTITFAVSGTGATISQTNGAAGLTAGQYRQGVITVVSATKVLIGGTA